MRWAGGGREVGWLVWGKGKGEKGGGGGAEGEMERMVKNEICPANEGARVGNGFSSVLVSSARIEEAPTSRRHCPRFLRVNVGIALAAPRREGARFGGSSVPKSLSM